MPGLTAGLRPCPRKHPGQLLPLVPVHSIPQRLITRSSRVSAPEVTHPFVWHAPCGVSSACAAPGLVEPTLHEGAPQLRVNRRSDPDSQLEYRGEMMPHKLPDVKGVALK